MKNNLTVKVKVMEISAIELIHYYFLFSFIIIEIAHQSISKKKIGTIN